MLTSNDITCTFATTKAGLVGDIGLWKIPSSRNLHEMIQTHHQSKCEIVDLTPTSTTAI